LRGGMSAARATYAPAACLIGASNLIDAASMAGEVVQLLPRGLVPDVHLRDVTRRARRKHIAGKQPPHEGPTKEHDDPGAI